MNILFLLGVYPGQGGVEKVTSILSNEFQKNGYQISIISFEQLPSHIEDNPTINLYRLHYPVLSLNNILRIKKIIVNNNINIIINQWVVPFHVTLLCKIAIGNKLCKIISVHHNLPNTNKHIKRIEFDITNNNGSKFLNLLKFYIVKLISRISLRLSYTISDCFVVLSPSFTPLIKEFLFLKDTKKIQTISNPLTISSKPKTIIKKRKEIIYVGRIENNQKRIDRLIDIWEDLNKKYVDWEMTIVGDGPDLKYFENLTKKKQLKRISFVGYKNPKEYYERASILLLVSEYEGFGLVILESMAYGVVPIVLGSYGAVYDIISHGNDGFISSYPYNKEEMIQYIESLINNPTKIEQMGQQGQYKSNSFMLPKITNQWYKLFNKIYNK